MINNHNFEIESQCKRVLEAIKKDIATQMKYDKRFVNPC